MFPRVLDYTDSIRTLLYCIKKKKTKNNNHTMYSNIQESTSNLFYGMFTFALKKMLQIFIWKNSISRFMETLKYLIIYQF